MSESNNNTPHYQSKVEVDKVIIESQQQNERFNGAMSTGDKGYTEAHLLSSCSNKINFHSIITLDEDNLDIIVKGYGKVHVALLLVKIDQMVETCEKLQDRLDKLETELSVIKGERSS